ncbi:uncharacterized protein [Scyliorhinus torazame]|uniref:uncharacterized protein n=1 Tax=Scyliorhinus torazame TaxID=75743 RepID=UPI003B59F918
MDTPASGPSPATQEECSRDVFQLGNEGTGDYSDHLAGALKTEAQPYQGSQYLTPGQANLLLGPGPNQAPYPRINLHQLPPSYLQSLGLGPFPLDTNGNFQNFGTGVNVNTQTIANSGANGYAPYNGGHGFYTNPSGQLFQGVQGSIPSYQSVPWADFCAVSAQCPQTLYHYPGYGSDANLYAPTTGVSSVHRYALPSPAGYPAPQRTQALPPNRNSMSASQSCPEFLPVPGEDPGLLGGVVVKEEPGCSNFPQEVSHSGR